MAGRKKRDIGLEIRRRLALMPGEETEPDSAAAVIADAIVKRAMEGDSGAIKTVLALTAAPRDDGGEQAASKPMTLEIRVIGADEA